jgi:hypothetical protein
VPDQTFQNLAIWGAVTGTIGTLAGIANLYLRYRHHKVDRADLVCSAELNYELVSNEPRPQFKIIARSKGRRPVTVDFIRYYLRPDSFWAALFCPLKWLQGQWRYDQEERSQKITLNEGRKAEISVKLPWIPALVNIARVAVFDETGKKWLVSWPSQRVRRKLDKNEKLDEHSEKQDGRWYELHGMVVGGEYRILLRWHKTPNNDQENYEREIRCSSSRKYRAKLSDLKENQLPKLMAGDIEVIS